MTTMTVWLLLLWVAFVFLIVPTLCETTDEQVCDADGICAPVCKDLNPNCEQWASEGDCFSAGSRYMFRVCPKACKACWRKDVKVEDEEEDYGVEQAVTGSSAKDVEQAIAEMKEYFARMREDPSTTPKMHSILDNCKNQHENCAFWKTLGECDVNPRYMKINCALACQTCEHLSLEHRCPLDPDAPNAWGPGDLNHFFTNITTLSEFQKYEPVILSRPDYMSGDTAESAKYMIGPWVVTLDNFVTDEEADRLVELGREEGYERSKDVGALKFDGSFSESVNNGRTSTNAWCQNSCYNDTVAKAVIDKITEITKIPETNSEYLQLLQYEVGQFYNVHHDYIDFQLDRQPGVRMITIFLYLNDVEAGGGTNFPSMNLTVMPKKGRALIWPSVLDEDPNKKDKRTMHQALPVEAGKKYGANAWIHMRDFKTPNLEGCM